MTHDTPPKRIWAYEGPSGNTLAWPFYIAGASEYILTSEADAMVAAALRGAVRVAVEAAIDYWDETKKPVEQRKHGGKGLPACVAAEIEALIPAPASAALDKLIAEAEAAERERCTKIAEDHAERFAEATYKTEDGRLQNAAKVYGADEIAAAIRATKGDQT